MGGTPSISTSTIICAGCGAENPVGFRFCGGCGANLQHGREGPAARKVVTILFCDVTGSTELGERLDPEALGEVLDRYLRDVAGTIERHGGTVEKFVGDAVMAVFGIPQVHEDDALRAVRAAMEIQERLPALAEEVGLALRMRIGVNTGLVITDEGKSLALGDAVNVAARLEQAARPDEILLGSQTLELVRDAVTVEPLEPLQLKGKSEGVIAYRLLSVDLLAPGVARRLHLPLVNRTRELSLLREVWELAVETSSCQQVTLIGVAGMGKSRLAEEMCRTVAQDAGVLRGRCLNYGEGVTFRPLIEALSSAGEEAQDVVRHLSEGGAATAQELFLEVRGLLATLAAERPLILYIDDLQWAEPMLLELLENLLSGARASPLLILCAARPELLEDHPGWGWSRENATTVTLEPLGAQDCEQLLDQLAPGLDEDTRRRVIRRSDGNPLFAEEMATLARDRGTGELPPTIHSLLAARIEGLPSGELDVLVRAAAEGEVFHRSAVRALADEPTSEPVDRHLVELVRKDVIRPHRAEVAGDQAFRFRHLLIRDAAYEQLPRSRRAEFHQRLATWLEQRAGAVPEHEELAAWHLEQAIGDWERIRRKVELETALRAVGHLQVAARRAANRTDLSAARKLLERALRLTPTASALHLELTTALVEYLIELGDLGEADHVLSALERDHPGEPSVSLSRLEWMFHVRPAEADATYRARSSSLERDLAERGDERGLAALHMLGFWLEWISSQATAAADQVRRAAEHALAAGDLALRARALGWLVATLIFGPSSAAEMASELESIEREQPGPYLQAYLDLGHGEVLRLGGRTEEAAALTERALESFRSLSMLTMVATCQQQLAWIRLRAGQAAAARDWARRSDAILAAAGETSVRSTTQALLARAAQRLGASAEALAAVAESESLSSPSDVWNFGITHAVQARLAMATGEAEEAERWARSAVEYALRTDDPVAQAETLMELAEVLIERGRPAEARAQLEAAGERYRSKNDRHGLEAVSALLERLAV